jgi:hypothetical protein
VTRTRLVRALVGVGAIALLGLPTVAATASDASSRAARRHAAVTLQAVDGGRDFARRFSASLPDRASFFPIGVWYESVTDRAEVAQDRAAGLNTYVQVTADSDVRLMHGAGMHVITDAVPADVRSLVTGWLLSDEIDMALGPGWAAAHDGGDRPQCSPAAAECGYTVMRDRAAALPDDHRLRYANYGKGVTFWEADAEAAVFVNRFQDVVSADNYWFTDPNICGRSEGGALLAHGARALRPSECRRASNYGATVDRLRSLVRPAGSKPVWAFVEVGHPFEGDAPTIRPPEVRAAVWSSLIHGARGIIYFNHSVGGSCETQHALRESCYSRVRKVVTETNHQITELAPVLNSPSVLRGLQVDGPVDALTKWSGGSYYVFAGSRADGSHHVAFTLACTDDAVVTVLGEHRRIDVHGGRFVDTFADADAVHLYRVDGGTTCEPRAPADRRSSSSS